MDISQVAELLDCLVLQDSEKIVDLRLGRDLARWVLRVDGAVGRQVHPVVDVSEDRVAAPIIGLEIFLNLTAELLPRARVVVEQHPPVDVRVEPVAGGEEFWVQVCANVNIARVPETDLFSAGVGFKRFVFLSRQIVDIHSVPVDLVVNQCRFEVNFVALLTVGLERNALGRELVRADCLSHQLQGFLLRSQLQLDNLLSGLGDKSIWSF